MLNEVLQSIESVAFYPILGLLIFVLAFLQNRYFGRED